MFGVIAKCVIIVKMLDWEKHVPKTRLSSEFEINFDTILKNKSYVSVTNLPFSS